MNMNVKNNFKTTSRKMYYIGKGSGMTYTKPYNRIVAIIISVIEAMPDEVIREVCRHFMYGDEVTMKVKTYATKKEFKESNTNIKQATHYIKDGVLHVYTKR